MRELTDKQKVIIISIRAGPKSCLCIPLCRMVVNTIVHHALKYDITKLEVDFFNGYCDGDRVFYISFNDSK